MPRRLNPSNPRRHLLEYQTTEPYANRRLQDRPLKEGDLVTKRFSPEGEGEDQSNASLFLLSLGAVVLAGGFCAFLGFLVFGGF